MSQRTHRGVPREAVDIVDEDNVSIGDESDDEIDDVIEDFRCICDDEQDEDDEEGAGCDPYDPSDSDECDDYDDDDELSEDEEETDPTKLVRVLKVPDQIKGKSTKKIPAFIWSGKEPRSQTRIPKRNIVFHVPGNKPEAKGILDELEVWRLFFTPNILNVIVKHTNEKIREENDKAKEKGHVEVTYKGETTAEEITALFGLFYFAGSLHQNRTNVNDLYSKKYGFPHFRATMTQHRFIFLTSCLRMDNKTERAEKRNVDRGAAVREVFDHIVETSKRLYTPSDVLTIDEQLLQFHGKCPFKVYIGNKPDKFGMKILMLCDAKSWYMLNAELYVGKAPKEPAAKTKKTDPKKPEVKTKKTNPKEPAAKTKKTDPKEPAVKTKKEDKTGKSTKESAQPLAEQYLLRLSQPIHGSNRTVVCDNWFTSIPAAEKLLKKEITLVGTVRKNKREIPPEFVDVKTREKLTSMFAYHDALTLLSWCPDKKKKKVVLMLSTTHDLPDKDLTKKRPEIVEFYNKNKGGVDVFDRLCKNYSTSRSTKRWPVTVLFGLLNIVGINSFILWRNNVEDNKTKTTERKRSRSASTSSLSDTRKTILRKEFLRRLSVKILLPYWKKRLTDTPTLMNETKEIIKSAISLEEEHPTMPPPPPSPAKKERRESSSERGDCYICRPLGIRRQTRTKCDKCSEWVCPQHQITLCKNCKEKYCSSKIVIKKWDEIEKK